MRPFTRKRTEDHQQDAAQTHLQRGCREDIFVAVVPLRVGGPDRPATARELRGNHPQHELPVGCPGELAAQAREQHDAAKPDQQPEEMAGAQAFATRHEGLGADHPERNHRDHHRRHPARNELLCPHE